MASRTTQVGVGVLAQSESPRVTQVGVGVLAQNASPRVTQVGVGVLAEYQSIVRVTQVGVGVLVETPFGDEPCECKPTESWNQASCRAEETW